MQICHQVDACFQPFILIPVCPHPSNREATVGALAGLQRAERPFTGGCEGLGGVHPLCSETARRLFAFCSGDKRGKKQEGESVRPRSRGVLLDPPGRLGWLVLHSPSH